MAPDSKPPLNRDVRERRREDRVKLILPGRYLDRDGHEYPCSTIDISSGGVAVRGLASEHLGERVVIYIEEIGRIEGLVVRLFGECFAVTVQAPPIKRERLAEKIARLVHHLMLAAPDQRQNGHEVPDTQSMLWTPNRGEHFGTLIKVSYRTAALKVEAAPRVGPLLTIRHESKRVVPP